MSENKLKLNLQRKLSGNDKSPSPGKLMINHGKPNFTINRQNSSNYKKFHLESPTNEIDKIVLKSCPVNNTDSILSNGNNNTLKTQNHKDTNNKIQKEFIEKHRKISEKLNSKEEQHSNGHLISPTTPAELKQEFLDRHRKISEKLNARDIDSIDNGINEIQLEKENDRSCVKTMIMKNENNLEKPIVGSNSNNNNKQQPQFIKIDNNRIQTGTAVLMQNSAQPIPIGALISGKPYLPKKPIGLTTPPAATAIENASLKYPIVNGNVHGEAAAVSTNGIGHNNNGVNYEQKTIVSFSKDLSVEPNRYPDTVKVMKTIDHNDDVENASVLNELAQLKFDINTTNEDIVVTSVIR